MISKKAHIVVTISISAFIQYAKATIYSKSKRDLIQIAKSSLVRANQNRDYHIFEAYAYYLVNKARHIRVTDIFKLEDNGCNFGLHTI